MMAKNKITAYHGTSVTFAQNILEEQHFNESKSDTEWLGHGIYFFYYKEHATRWIAKRGLRAGKILTVQLEYTDEEMLDLDDPAQLTALNNELERVKELVKDDIALDNPHPQRDELHKMWCFGCNLYRDIYPQIGIISYTFHSGFGISHFQYNEKQLCVSKHQIITSIA